jgi:hypothetical protein
MLTIHSPTKQPRLLILLAFVCALCLGAQRITFAGDQIPFEASYNNEIEADFSGLPLVAVTSTGSALVSHLGNVTTHSISETVNLATGEGVAVHEFVAANGDTIQISFHFLAIPTSATSFSIEGVWQIIGGAGRFAGASGEGSYQGAAQFNSPTTASGEFELVGTISSVGSAKR